MRFTSEAEEIKHEMRHDVLETEQGGADRTCKLMVTTPPGDDGKPRTPEIRADKSSERHLESNERRWKTSRR